MIRPIDPGLERQLSEIKGVGKERVAQLERVGVKTVHELLLHRPRRYEDRRHFLSIAELPLQEAVSTRGTIIATGLKRWKHGTRSVFEMIIEDGSARLHCRWWNLPFMQNYFKNGDDVLVFGKLNSLKPRMMDHPETEVLVPGEEISIHMDRITPIYPLTEGLPQRWLRSLIYRVLRENEPGIREIWDGPLRGPAAINEQLGLPTRANAIHMLHCPEEWTDVELTRRKLALDEFVRLQFSIQNRRRELERRSRGLPCRGDNSLMRPFLGSLGFKLTESQMAVLRELRVDMGGEFPMRRLLQGDVGSGKTVVSACVALMAIESGFDVALMAPTQILAEQHFQNFRGWLDGLGVEVHLLTGAEKQSPASGALKGGTETKPCGRLYIGTHALIESRFIPARLGLVIIDEQHKFGVAQRERLVRKGNYPHLLVMTATPIPRTLGLTIYGDLDISVIQSVPEGRGKVTTFVRRAEKLPKVHEFVRAQLAEGRQAYVVCPRIEASEDFEVKAVEKELSSLQKEYSGYRVGLLHGRLRWEEREKVMQQFRGNQLQVLLATSVIEVGVDVPNATVMLIESAEQFGLAQLHQLRGRIGRGRNESFCILVAQAKTDDGLRRLTVMEQTHDGFRIAEEDMRMRGPGQLAGREQSGETLLRFGDLERDAVLVEEARELVRENLKLK